MLLFGTGTGGVEDVADPPLAVGKPAQRGAHPALAVVEHVGPGGRGRVGAAQHVDQRGEPSDPEPVGAALGLEIAAPLVAGARRLDDEGDGVGVEAHRREPQTLLVDRARVGRHRTGRDAADIGVVRAVGDPADQLAAHRHRGHDRDVVEVGAAGEGIVEDHVTEAHRIGAGRRDRGQDRRRHRPEVHRDVLGLGEQLPAPR